MKPLTPVFVLPLAVKLNEDLFDSITAFVENNQIQSARFQGIGLLKQTTLEFYDQKTKEPVINKISGPMEMVSLIGNVSDQNGKAVIKAKLVAADGNAELMGGALMKGTIVFKAEILFDVFEGNSLKRQFDSETGLSLWKLDQE